MPETWSRTPELYHRSDVISTGGGAFAAVVEKSASLPQPAVRLKIRSTVSQIPKTRY
jgi:hypothetical protein